MNRKQARKKRRGINHSTDDKNSSDYLMNEENENKFKKTATKNFTITYEDTKRKKIE